MIRPMRCAASRLAEDANRAAMLPDDVGAGRETQTRAALWRFGGEEWLEEALPGRRVDAHTGVADRQPHVMATWTATLRARRRLECDIRGTDSQSSAVRHRIAGVDHQVD